MSIYLSMCVFVFSRLWVFIVCAGGGGAVCCAFPVPEERLLRWSCGLHPVASEPWSVACSSQPGLALSRLGTACATLLLPRLPVCGRRNPLRRPPGGQVRLFRLRWPWRIATWNNADDGNCLTSYKYSFSCLLWVCLHICRIHWYAMQQALPELIWWIVRGWPDMGLLHIVRCPFHARPLRWPQHTCHE